ncbi:MAG TPA: type II secretion system protein N [Legionellaceae bacterium]|nr:type II secretion system protein N [Legionellaceae bacterium]
MFSVRDIEDKLLRPITAQIIFFMAAALFLYAVISGSVMFYQVHSELQIPPTHPSRLNSSTPIRHKQRLNVHIFGEYVPKILGDASVKPSELNVSIAGIVFSPENHMSQVIINISDGDSRSFSVGDTLPGGAKIKQITPDGVIIEREGELESLSLPKNDLIFEPLPTPLSEDNP